MSFRFLHTSDWHIGKSFGSLPSERAAVLRQARLDMVATLGDVAMRNHLQHVLVAGDVFDQHQPDDQTVNTLVARLANYPSVIWHMLPGNHDFADARGVWSRIEKMGCPENVRLHVHATPVEIEKDVCLLPAPLWTKFPASDPTAWMTEGKTPDGAIRLGLAHGSVRNFGQDDEGHRGVIASTRAGDANLDYLALGDWHGTTKVSDKVWYSGAPEPDSFRHNTPGQSLIVEIGTAGAMPDVQPVETGRFTWNGLALNLSGVDDMQAWLDEIRRLGAASQSYLYKVHIDGQIPLADRAALADIEKDATAHLFHCEIAYADTFDVLLAENDLDTLADDSLRAIARELSAEANQTDDDAKAAIAKEALHVLFAVNRRLLGGAA